MWLTSFRPKMAPGTKSSECHLSCYSVCGLKFNFDSYPYRQRGVGVFGAMGLALPFLPLCWYLPVRYRSFSESCFLGQTRTISGVDDCLDDLKLRFKCIIFSLEFRICHLLIEGLSKVFAHYKFSFRCSYSNDTAWTVQFLRVVFLSLLVKPFVSIILRPITIQNSRNIIPPVLRGSQNTVIEGFWVWLSKTIFHLPQRVPVSEKVSCLHILGKVWIPRSGNVPSSDSFQKNSTSKFGIVLLGNIGSYIL